MKIIILIHFDISHLLIQNVLCVVDPEDV